jgi:hypothetical protein
MHTLTCKHTYHNKIMQMEETAAQLDEKLSIEQVRGCFVCIYMHVTWHARHTRVKLSSRLTHIHARTRTDVRVYNTCPLICTHYLHTICTRYMHTSYTRRQKHTNNMQVEEALTAAKTRVTRLEALLQAKRDDRDKVICMYALCMCVCVCI